MFSHSASWRRIARVVVAPLVTTAVGIPVAHAQVSAIDGDVPSLTVNYSDLNLATTEGSHALYRRLVAAAEQVCPRVGYATEIRHNREAQRCISTSVERAVKQIKSPRFAQVAKSRMR